MIRGEQQEPVETTLDAMRRLPTPLTLLLESGMSALWFFGLLLLAAAHFLEASDFGWIRIRIRGSFSPNASSGSTKNYRVAQWLIHSSTRSRCLRILSDILSAEHVFWNLKARTGCMVLVSLADLEEFFGTPRTSQAKTICLKLNGVGA